MPEISTLSEKQKNTAIDMLVAMIAEELAQDLKMEPRDALTSFIESETGKLLYDEQAKLWWLGPSDIAEMYKMEMMKSK